METSTAGAVQTVRPAMSVVGLLSCMIAAAAAGLIGGFILKSTADHTVIKLTKELEDARGTFSPEQRIQVRAIELAADYRNVLLSMSIVGGLTAAFVGLAAGKLSGTSGGMLVGACLGAVAGGLFGAGGGALALVVRESLRGWDIIGEAGRPDIVKSQLHAMAIHAPTWIGVALGVAVAVAGASRNRRQKFLQSAGAGITGWIIAGLLFPIVASIIFTDSDPDLVIPSGDMSRVLWTTLSATLIGMMVGRNLTPESQPPVT
ncbi:MAG: hypothetical protein JNL58_08305 [Planctomyces sp.]|nr:hypothetical protein [Planctomyces sp.]